jgi:Putative MetA-pathway of phenol degradation
MKKITLLFVFCLFSIMSFAQETETTEPIQTDRPDQTETPALVPKGMFQVETGFSFQKNDRDNNTSTTPSSLWKYGVNENFELRLITEFSSEDINNQKTSGLNPVLIGCKIKIAEEKGIWPKTSFIGHMSLPNLASKEFKSDYFAPEFRFVMQHTLSEKMSFSYNLGAEWDGFTPEPTFIYTIATGYSISNNWGSYIELFGFAPQNTEASHNFDGGLTYLINNNTMLDVSAGVGLTENSFQHYFALGFSFRI